METWNNNPFLNVISEPTYSLDYVFKNNKLYKVQLFLETHDQSSIDKLIENITIKNNFILDKSTSNLIVLTNPVNMDIVQILKYTKYDNTLYYSVYFIEVDMIDKI
jgi:hypothetical protein